MRSTKPCLIVRSHELLYIVVAIKFIYKRFFVQEVFRYCQGVNDTDYGWLESTPLVPEVPQCQHLETYRPTSYKCGRMKKSQTELNHTQVSPGICAQYRSTDEHAGNSDNNAWCCPQWPLYKVTLVFTNGILI